MLQPEQVRVLNRIGQSDMAFSRLREATRRSIEARSTESTPSRRQALVEVFRSRRRHQEDEDEPVNYRVDSDGNTRITAEGERRVVSLDFRVTAEGDRRVTADGAYREVVE